METVRTVEQLRSDLEERALAPLRRTSKGFYLLAGLLVVIILWGVYAYFVQLRDGFYVTGMRDRIMWGLYIALFVFFIGASMGGTFISAILRVTQAPWRTPITRAAELITVSALIIASLFILFDMGRPERVLNLVRFGRWESPLTWDIYGLATYLTGSVLYLYLALVPDLAICRDSLGSAVSAPKRWFFRTFAVGWTGGPEQRKALGSAITIMMILIIPVAVVMHTVTSWIFAMTLREPWDSAMFGIYFVSGAVYSGTGLVIILMAILRKAYRLEEYITQRHFIYLGYFLAAFALIMLFFNANEFIVHGFKLRGEVSHHIDQLFTGDLAAMFWFYLIGGLLLPPYLILYRRTRRPAGIITAAILVNIAMFIERYIIVVGGLDEPLNPYAAPTYSPTWVEWSLMAAGIAGFALIILLALKLMPGMAVWEIVEQREEEEAQIESIRAAIAAEKPSDAQEAAT